MQNGSPPFSYISHSLISILLFSNYFAEDMACPSLESPGSSKSTVKSWARNLSVDQAVEIARKVKKHGKDDPRRVIHSLKVGLALMLISLFYYFRPGFGDEAMWAVLTVVVVFEFTVGMYNKRHFV